MQRSVKMGPMGLMRLRLQLPGCFSTLYRLRRVCTAHEQVLQEGDSSHDGQGESRGDRFSELVRFQILQIGLRSLKGDIEKLRENIKNRASTANVDKLVQIIACLPWLAPPSVPFLPHSPCIGTTL